MAPRAMRPRSIRVNDTLWAAFKAMAKARDEDASVALRRMMRAYINNHEVNEATVDRVALAMAGYREPAGAPGDTPADALRRAWHGRARNAIAALYEDPS